MRPFGENSRPAGRRQSTPFGPGDRYKRTTRTPANKNRASGRPHAELPRSAQNQAPGRFAANLRRHIRPSDIRQQSQQKERIHRSVKSLHSPNSSPNRGLSLEVILSAAKLPRRLPHTPAPDAPTRNSSPSHSTSASANRPYPETLPAPGRSQPSDPAPDTRKT
jgi:hypothetical protein